MDTEKKGFPGEPIGKGDYNISAFCPALRHSFSKENGCQGASGRRISGRPTPEVAVLGMVL